MQHQSSVSLVRLGSLLSLALSFVLAFSACSSSEPKKPHNEREKKLHEDPARVVFSLEAVTVPNDAFDPNRKEIATTALSQPKQEIEMRETAKGWKITSSRQAFDVNSATTNPNLAYIFRISYYSPTDKLMNYQFIENGQDKIHQHFFHYYTTGEKPVRVKDADKIPWLYRYCDTTPDATGRKLYPSDDNPIGFIGLMRFPRAMEEQVTLTLELLHAYDSKFLKDGKPSPYYYMHPSKRSQGSDINVDIHLTIKE